MYSKNRHVQKKQKCAETNKHVHCAFIHTQIEKNKHVKTKTHIYKAKQNRQAYRQKKNTKKTSTDKNRYVHNKTDIYWQKQISTAKTVVGPYGSNVSTESY